MDTPTTPSPLLPETDRVVAAMLGLAIGDALGAPVSGWPPDRIVERLGVVDRYPDLDRLPGLYTARSQQALAVQDTLLEEGKLDPLGLAARLVQLSKQLHQKWPIYGAYRDASRGFREAVDRLAAGVPWEKAGSLSAANDPAVRVAPLALWSRDHRVVLFRDDVAHSVLPTHRDPRALAGAMAVGYALVNLVNLPAPGRFDPRGFLHEVMEFTADAEAYIARSFWPADSRLPRDAAHDLSSILKRADGWLGHTLPAALDSVTRAARPLGDGKVRASSAFAVASVPTALLILARSAAHPRQAVIDAVNIGGDAGGIGAMVAAMAGALHGLRAFPAEWLAGLQNADALRARAVALAEGTGLPADAPKLPRMEAALTEAELPRLRERRHTERKEDPDDQ